MISPCAVPKRRPIGVTRRSQRRLRHDLHNEGQGLASGRSLRARIRAPSQS
jgi:hypothetical protein